MHTSADFRENFLALLKQKGLSQLDIAEKSGIHQQTINRYATGKTSPRWEELLKLADALNCSLDSFLTGELTVSPLGPDPRVEEMKPIVKELGSVVSRLTSIISR